MSAASELDLALKELEKADTNGAVNSGTLSDLAQSSPVSAWTPELVIILSISFLIFGLVVLIVIVNLAKKDIDSSAILKITGLPLIVVSATFLIVVGYSQSQIAPVIGLLGTIAGYLLGYKSNTHKETNAKEPPPTSLD